MNSLFRIFMDRLAERIFAIIGSTVGTAASTCRAIAQAEQQSVLEDLARQYESEGKMALAENLRRQAAQISEADPAGDGAAFLENLIGTEPGQALGLQRDADTAGPAPSRTRRRRRLDGPLQISAESQPEQES